MYCNGGEEIKLDEESISEILVADTDSETGSEPNDFEDYLKEKEEENPQQKQQTSANSKHMLQEMANYQTGDRLKEGTQIFLMA